MSIEISKHKCICCKKSKTSFRLNCKYCDIPFCCKCIQPEIHDCLNINKMKVELHTSLKRKLDSEKCVGKKIQRI